MGRVIGGTRSEQCNRLLDEILREESSQLNKASQDNPGEKERSMGLLGRWRGGIEELCKTRFAREAVGAEKVQEREWRRFLYTLLTILNREEQGLSIIAEDSPSEVYEDYLPSKISAQLGDHSNFPPWVSDYLSLPVESGLRREHSLDVVMDPVVKLLRDGNFMSSGEVDKWHKKMKELPSRHWRDGEWKEMIELVKELKGLLDSNKIFSSASSPILKTFEMPSNRLRGKQVLNWDREFQKQWTPEFLVQRAIIRKEKEEREREAARSRAGRSRFHPRARRY
ncbi:hypothetical protein JCM3765_000175 [Sporobolomyces pararoseus]